MALNFRLILAGAAILATSYSLWTFKPTSERKNSLLRPKTKGVASLIGNTPMIEIESLSKLTGCKIYAKLELMNPAGSAKDRVALAIIRENEKLGKLTPHTGDVIYEGTSGSTGISFSVLANALGYTAHICLPSDTSPEKIQLLESLGAKVEPVKPAPIVDPNQYTNAARAGADRINNDPGDLRKAIFADQFENDFNWRIHYSTTGPEIWAQMEEDIDLFITGSGTGGTIAGVSRYLKSKGSKHPSRSLRPAGLGFGESRQLWGNVRLSRTRGKEKKTPGGYSCRRCWSQ